MNKKDYLEETKRFLQTKIEQIDNALKDTQESANSDTKSSAGDKHETSRAMAHIENERLAGQYASLQAQMDVLQRINPSVSSKTVSLGSVVKTENSLYFISTGIGKITVSGTSFFAIATNSPVAISMLGKTIGDTIIAGNQSNTITNVE